MTGLPANDVAAAADAPLPLYLKLHKPTRLKERTFVNSKQREDQDQAQAHTQVGENLGQAVTVAIK
jgi:hypothetical protein